MIRRIRSFVRSFVSYPGFCKSALRCPWIGRRGAAAGASRSLQGRARRSRGPGARPDPGAPGKAAPAQSPELGELDPHFQTTRIVRVEKNK